MAQDPIRMVADKRLEKDLQAATTPEEIQQLLLNAVERSGIADRDPQTGRWVRRDPLAPAAQTVEPEARVLSKTVTIGGKEFTFTASSEETLQAQIESAEAVADELSDQSATAATRKSAVERAEEILREQERRTELEAMLRSGLITTQQFLESSGSIDQYLASRGVDVEKIAGQQYTESWEKATKRFLYSEAGKDWPGGDRNLQVIGATLAAMGLTDSPSVESLALAWQEMKAKGTVFNNTSDEQMLKETEDMTPLEILEKFKSVHSGDPEAANQGFIEAHRGGRIGGSSGIFGR